MLRAKDRHHFLEKGPKTQFMMLNGTPVAQDLGRQSGNQGAQTWPGHMQEGPTACSYSREMQYISDGHSHQTKTVHSYHLLLWDLLSVCPGMSLGMSPGMSPGMPWHIMVRMKTLSRDICPIPLM